ELAMDLKSFTLKLINVKPSSALTASLRQCQPQAWIIPFQPQMSMHTLISASCQRLVRHITMQNNIRKNIYGKASPATSSHQGAGEGRYVTKAPHPYPAHTSRVKHSSTI